jgi:hypothetical protein
MIGFSGEGPLKHKPGGEGPGDPHETARALVNRGLQSYVLQKNRKQGCHCEG